MAELTELERAAACALLDVLSRHRDRDGVISAVNAEQMARDMTEAARAVLAAVVPMVRAQVAEELEREAARRRENHQALGWPLATGHDYDSAARYIRALYALDGATRTTAMEMPHAPAESAPEATGEADGSGVTVEAPEGSEAGYATGGIVSGAAVIVDPDVPPGTIYAIPRQEPGETIADLAQRSAVIRIEGPTLVDLLRKRIAEEDSGECQHPTRLDTTRMGDNGVRWRCRDCGHEQLDPPAGQP